LVSLAKGRVALVLGFDDPMGPGVARGNGWETFEIRADPWAGTLRLDEKLDHHAGGFGYERFVAFLRPGWDEPAVKRYLVVPHWFLALAFAALPAFRLARRRRPIPGLCPSCGYDLRATPDRCPECGALPRSDRNRRHGRVCFAAFPPTSRPMSIPKVEYGTFSVLTVCPFDFVALYTAPTEVQLLGASKDATERLVGIVRRHGGEGIFIAGEGVAVWPCKGSAPDARVVAAAMAIIAEFGPAASKAPDWGSVPNGLSIGACHGPILYQRQNKALINVLGPAIKRSQQLERLARERRSPMIVDSAIATLLPPEMLQQIDEDSWMMRS
jgi:hypothetical protein